MTPSPVDLLRLPPAPRHEAPRDGNPFAWIVANAPKVRAQQQVVIQQHRARVRAELED